MIGKIYIIKLMSDSNLGIRSIFRQNLGYFRQYKLPVIMTPMIVIFIILLAKIMYPFFLVNV